MNDTRRVELFLRCLLLVLVLEFSCVLTNVRAQTADDPQGYANLALQSFLVNFWTGQTFRGKRPDDGSQTGYWTYAHGWDAVMDGIERTSKQQYRGWTATLYLAQNKRGWIVPHYDDECWMSLALLRAYDLTGDSTYFQTAKGIFDDIRRAWDTTCCGANPGGLWWDKAKTQKPTASNAGAAFVAARLFSLTGEVSYLSFAEQVYSYWRQYMVNPATHQVCDHILPNGTKQWWRFTYNEGLMIGAALALYKATGHERYLADAHNYAGYMIRHEVTATRYGNVLYDGPNASCDATCAQFKGPAYRYLAQLYLTDRSKKEYYQVLKASADAIWNLARNAQQNTFAVNWAGPPQSVISDSQQNAAAMALNISAQIEEPYRGSGIPANQYEAEDGVLHNISLEADHPGFEGWAYLAGWNRDGQWVDFNVNIPTPGRQTLVLRYAAGAGDASRLIYINGTYAFPNQVFRSTGGWDRYSTVTVSYDLPRGRNTISVILNSSRGNKNWLNLDNLIVKSPPGTVPGRLSVGTERNNIELLWEGDGLLQSAPDLEGPWLDFAGNPTPPVVVPVPALDGGSTFFRLRH